MIFQEICLAFKCLAAFKALEYQTTVKCPFKASENQSFRKLHALGKTQSVNLSYCAGIIIIIISDSTVIYVVSRRIVE